MTQPTPQPQPPPTAPNVALEAAVFALLEASIAALVLAAYTAWLSLVAAAVLAAFSRFGVAPDPSAVWSTVPAWERQVDRLMDGLEEIARKGWDAAAQQLGVDVRFDAGDPIVVDVLQRTRNLMVRTPDEVYRRIVDEVGKVVAAGGDVGEQAAAVRHLLDVTGTENWPSRAQTVAVTEVHRAWNMGAFALAMRQQTLSMQRLFKRWLSRDDAAVRPGHRAADGQTVVVADPFMVSGEALMFPGDPGGSASNVINCRCKPLFLRRL